MEFGLWSVSVPFWIAALNTGRTGSTRIREGWAENVVGRGTGSLEEVRALRNNRKSGVYLMARNHAILSSALDFSFRDSERFSAALLGLLVTL